MEDTKTGPFSKTFENGEKMKTDHSRDHKVDFVRPAMKPDHADHQHCGVRNLGDLSNFSK